MSRYLLPPTQQADLEPASTPFFGGEYAVYLSTLQAVVLGILGLTGPSLGTYTASVINLFPTGIASVAVTGAGTGFTGTAVAAASIGTGATFQVNMGILTVAPTGGSVGTGHQVGDVLTIVETGATYTVPLQIRVSTVSGGAITAATVLNAGLYQVLPTNALAVVLQGTTTGTGVSATFTLTWGVQTVTVLTPGINYTSSTTITITGGGGSGATATMTQQAGYDLQLMVDNFLLSSVPTTVTFNATAPDASSFTITATIQAPTFTTNQTQNFQKGFAVDFIPSVAGKKVSALVGPPIITGGSKGCSLKVMALPDSAVADPTGAYTLVGFCNEKDFTSPSREGVAIADGMISNAATKRGRNPVPNLTITAKHVNQADGMARFDGLQCTAMLFGLKDSQLAMERIVFSNYFCTVDRKNPDGQGEAMADAKGTYTNVMYFLASN